MATVTTNNPILVNVRVEAGGINTVFEGDVTTYGHDVMPDSGCTYRCDGTNGNENPLPGPTCTSALDDASRPPFPIPRPFTWDAEYYQSLDDLFMTEIGNYAATPGETFWALYLNFKSAQVGGCQQQIESGDSVLWALVPITEEGDPMPIALKLKGPLSVLADEEFTVSVINGFDRTAVEGAEVGGVTTDAWGNAKLTLPAGTHMLKATKDKDITSNVLKVVVT